jgi:hypothetical protein
MLKDKIEKKLIKNDKKKNQFMSTQVNLRNPRLKS